MVVYAALVSLWPEQVPVRLGQVSLKALDFPRHLIPPPTETASDLSSGDGVIKDCQQHADGSFATKNFNQVLSHSRTRLASANDGLLVILTI